MSLHWWNLSERAGPEIVLTVVPYGSSDTVSDGSVACGLSPASRKLMIIGGLSVSLDPLIVLSSPPPSLFFVSYFFIFCIFAWLSANGKSSQFLCILPLAGHGLFHALRGNAVPEQYECASKAFRRSLAGEMNVTYGIIIRAERKVVTGK